MREDISEKLAGLPSAKRMVSLQLMVHHTAFVAKAIGQGAPSADPAYQGVKSAFPWAALCVRRSNEYRGTYQF